MSYAKNGGARRSLKFLLTDIWLVSAPMGEAGISRAVFREKTTTVLAFVIVPHRGSTKKSIRADMQSVVTVVISKFFGYLSDVFLFALFARAVCSFLLYHHMSCGVIAHSESGAP